MKGQDEIIHRVCTEAACTEIDAPMVRGYLEARALVEDGNIQKRLLSELVDRYVDMEKRVSALLSNTLPAPVAEEIRYLGRFAPRPYHCTIMFTDMVGFTRLAESIPGERLIELLDELFHGFDDIVARWGGTKVKTIGDAYMAVFGAPEPYEDHAGMAVGCALDFLAFLEEFNTSRGVSLQMRVGVHSGVVMAAVVGRDRMQFDVFGDDVNVAARFEAAGEPGRVNVSHGTYLMTWDKFDFEDRGEIALKNKVPMRAYFVRGEKRNEREPLRPSHRHC